MKAQEDISVSPLSMAGSSKDGGFESPLGKAGSSEDDNFEHENTSQMWSLMAIRTG